MRTGPLLFVSLLALLTGCAALPGIATQTPGSPTATGTGVGTGTVATTGAPTGTGTGTAGTASTGTGSPTSTPQPGNLTVEYVVRSGSVPSELGSVTVEFEVVFAERAGDLQECIGTLLGSRYEPTATPLPTPAGGCHSESGLSVDLAALDGTQTLGPFTVDGRFDGAHALVVRDVVPAYGNGTAPTAIHDTDFRAHVESGRSPGRFGVEIGVAIAAGADTPWKYAVVDRDFVPGTGSDSGNATGTDTGNGTGTGTSTGTSTGTGTGTGMGTHAGSGTGTSTGTGTGTQGSGTGTSTGTSAGTDTGSGS